MTPGGSSLPLASSDEDMASSGVVGAWKWNRAERNIRNSKEIERAQAPPTAWGPIKSPDDAGDAGDAGDASDASDAGDAWL